MPTVNQPVVVTCLTERTGYAARKRKQRQVSPSRHIGPCAAESSVN